VISVILTSILNKDWINLNSESSNYVHVHHKQFTQSAQVNEMAGMECEGQVLN